MLRLASAFVGLWACAAAQSTPPRTPEEAAVTSLPLVSHADEIPSLDGQTVVLKGTYTEVDVRKRHPRDTRPPNLLGHVALVLSDGRSVYLEPIWSNKALRPETERQTWRDQPVRVTGTLHARMPEPEVPVASLVAPCLSPVTTIEAQ